MMGYYYYNHPSTTGYNSSKYNLNLVNNLKWTQGQNVMFFLMTLQREEKVDDSNVINLVAYGGNKINIWVNCEFG